MVCLLAENLKKALKDCQKKFEVKNPKIDLIFNDFSENTEFSLNFLVVKCNNCLVHEKQKSIEDD